jgi:hypothetical protein
MGWMLWAGHLVEHLGIAQQCKRDQASSDADSGCRSTTAMQHMCKKVLLPGATTEPRCSQDSSRHSSTRCGKVDQRAEAAVQHTQGYMLWAGHSV